MASQFFLKKSPEGPEIEVRPSMKVGRLESNDIVLRNAPAASRHHATLMLEGEALFVEDTGSSNGTFVNGRRISSKTQIQNLDQLRFDIEEYVLRGPPVAADAQKTVFRSPEQDKTVFRPEVQASAAAAPAPASPRPAAPAAAQAPVAAAAAPAPVAKPAASTAPAPPPNVAVVTPPPPVAVADASAASRPERPPGARRDTADVSPRPTPSADGKVDKPGAWIDPANNDDAGKTKYFDRSGARATVFQPGSQQRPLDIQVPTLLIISGKRAGERVELRVQGTSQQWTVGSNAGLAVMLPDEGISHVHATLERSGVHWTVCNKLATNGVYVNSHATALRNLISGDRIDFGPVQTQFLLPEGVLRAGLSRFGTLRRLGSPQTWLAVAAFVVTLAAVLLVKKLMR